MPIIAFNWFCVTFEEPRAFASEFVDLANVLFSFMLKEISQERADD